MGLLRKIGGGALLAGAALAGNWVGDTLRASTTGEERRPMSLVHTTPDDQTVLGLNVVLTNFVPALLLALLAGRPRTLYAFVSGAVISALVGREYERTMARWLRQRAPSTSAPVYAHS